MSTGQLIDTLLINPTVHLAPSYRCVLARARACGDGGGGERAAAAAAMGMGARRCAPLPLPAPRSVPWNNPSIVV